MSFHDPLALERRARLAAERLLEQKQAELCEANRKIAARARLLSDEVIYKREEAQALRGENDAVRSDLERALTSMMIAERRLWDSLETIRDGFAIFDRNDVMIAANQAYLAAFEDLECVAPGISYSEILSISVEEGLVNIGDETRAAWIDRMLARWQQDVIEPATIRFWDDKFVKLMDRRTRDGDVVTLALNITETIRRETELEEAREKAEAASRAKSAILANMSHEIRTPMNGVVGMADILLESSLDDDQKLYVQTIRNSGEALLSIINDILDYSKIEANRLTLHPAEFDLERTIQEVLILVGPKAQQKGLQLDFDYDLFLPTSYVGDVGRIRQILTNLLGNAVKFTEQGQVVVRAVGVSAAPGLQSLTITVEDTGIGIEPEMCAHIFGEFNQIESELNRRFNGTGLGLTITRSLVELMSGEIWVDSRPGEGSSFGFRLTLPIAENESDGPTVPDWLERAFLLDEDEQSRRLTTGQLTALSLPVVSLASVRDIRNSPPGPRDVLVVSDPSGANIGSERFCALMADVQPAGTLILTHSIDLSAPKNVGWVEILPQPVGRAALVEALRRIAEPVSLEHRGPTGQMRKLRVLAAEDNKTNQLVFAKMLRNLNIDLVLAEDGVAALAEFEKERPDIVFTDISMPRMDGKEAAKRMRGIESKRQWPRTPIIAMTAHAMAGDAESILASGIDECMSKPLKKTALTDHILAAAHDSILPVLREPDGDQSRATGAPP